MSINRRSTSNVLGFADGGTLVAAAITGKAMNIRPATDRVNNMGPWRLIQLSRKRHSLVSATHPGRNYGEKPPSCIINLYTNKIQYGLFIAGTGTPIRETICPSSTSSTTTSPGVPPSLGLYISINIALLYLRENLTQGLLARLFDTWQPTISRTINTIINAIDRALAPPPEPEDLTPHLYGVIDSTLGPCYSWAVRPELYSGKRKTAARILPVITGQGGNIVFISMPAVGSVHDLTALRDTGVLDVLAPEHVAADKGYVGPGCDKPFKTVLSEAVGGRAGTV